MTAGESVGAAPLSVARGESVPPPGGDSEAVAVEEGEGVANREGEKSAVRERRAVREAAVPLAVAPTLLLPTTLLPLGSVEAEDV